MFKLLPVNYYLSSSSHVTGPYAREELIGSLKDGVIPRNAQICEEGTENWVPIQNLTGGLVPTVAHTPFTELDTSEKAQVTVSNYYNPKTPGVAVLLEVIPGFFLQTFGIGNIYAGNIITGIVLMLTYWTLLLVNIFLAFFLIGFVTGPLTFVVYLVVAILTAQSSANRANYRMCFKPAPRD